MRQENRGNWYLLTGLLIGIGLGLLYAWVLNPIDYVDTQPRTLSENYKEEYRRIIALAYQVEGDLGRAKERLLLIDPDQPARALAAQAQRMVAANASSSEINALVALASDLNSPETASGAVSRTTTPVDTGTETPQAVAMDATALETSVLEPTATQPPGEAIRTATQPIPTTTATFTQTPTITFTPLPTFTPRPSATPRPIPDALFTLLDRKKLCEAGSDAGLIQIQVTDAKGQPMPGVKVVVTWAGGEDVFYTGLAPDIGMGYADFKAAPGTAYSIRVGDASQEVRDVTLDGCGLLLSFTQQP